MSIVYLLVCFWYQEAVGHVVFTYQDLEPLHTTPHNSQFDTYYDGGIYGDQSYYYDEIPETTEFFAVNTKSSRTYFDHQGIKNKPYYDLHRDQRINTSERAKVDYTKKVGQKYIGREKTRAFYKDNRRNNDLDGHNGNIGVNSSGDSLAKSQRRYHNRDPIFRPITIPERQSQSIVTIFPIGRTPTTQSPFLDDATKSPANETPRQGRFRVPTTPIIQNAADPQGRSSNQRFRIRMTSEGISYVRGLMLSVLRRTQKT